MNDIIGMDNAPVARDMTLIMQVSSRNLAIFPLCSCCGPLSLSSPLLLTDSLRLASSIIHSAHPTTMGVALIRLTNQIDSLTCERERMAAGKSVAVSLTERLV